MSDEADASNYGDMGNDMDDFYGMINVNFSFFLHPLCWPIGCIFSDTANGVDELMGNENLESEGFQGSHVFVATSKTNKHNNATGLVDENMETDEVQGNNGEPTTSKTSKINNGNQLLVASFRLLQFKF